MLKVCREAHEEVTYATPVCPVCMVIAHFTEKVSELNERIEVLEGDVQEMAVVS